MVTDERDAGGLPVLVTDTLMGDAAARRRVARGDPAVRRVTGVSTYAILPVKHFERAKQRLGRTLSDGSRWALAEAMVTDVLVALRRAKAVDQVLMVTSEPRAESLAIGWGADVIADPQERSHSNAATLGIRAAVDRGATRVLLVPGDCPSLDPREVDDAARPIAERRAHRPGPPRHGHQRAGADPPDAIEPASAPAAASATSDLAREAGVALRDRRRAVARCSTSTRARTSRRCRTRSAASTGGAAHTRGMLARLGRL